MINFQNALKSLNPKQLTAVEALEGPVMVIAGPGTGKTHTLTLRIANILQKTDAKPSNILALTFTDSAAKNMQRRLQELIGNDAYKVKIQTFHSFCNEVIQQYPEKFGLSNRAGQISELEKLRLIEGLIEKEEFQYLKPFNAPMLYRDNIISTISDLKREGINPDEFLQFIKEAQKDFEENKQVNKKTGKLMRKWSDQEKLLKKNLELHKIYKNYQDELTEKEQYDYDDMILFVIDQFERDDDLLARFQEQYLYILVDEFQDTNGAQSKILELIGSFDNKPNIFVVGDDAQSIYRFQGANVENMYDFLQRYPDTQIITLDESYRCPEKILQGAESLISKNQGSLQNTIPQIKRSMNSHNKSQAAINFFSLDTEEDEALFITEQIQSLLQKKINPEEIAVIYRSHKDSSILKHVLAKNKISTNIVDPQNILEDEYIIKTIKLFEAINNPNDDSLLFNVLNYDFLKLERLSIFKLGHQAGSNRIHLFDSIIESNDEKIVSFANMLVGFANLNQNTHFVSLFEQVISRIGLLDFLKTEHRVDTLRALSKLFYFIERSSRGNWEYKLENFLSDIHALQENRINIVLAYSGTQKGINLLTAHKAKGLEFKHVFIMNTREGQWSNKRIQTKLKLPSNIINIQSSSTDNQIEEERRLFYVALTRAKQTATITFANKSIEDGREKEFNESQFLNEIEKTYLDKKEYSVSKNSQVSILEPPIAFDFNKHEKEFLAELVSNFRLSYSALNQYLEDPAKFLYSNLLRIPTPTEKALVLGSVIHKGLEAFNFDQKLEKTKNIESYVNLLYKLLSLENITQKEAEEIFKEGKNLLENYLNFYAKDNHLSVAEIEYNFFSHNVLLEDIKLTGKIDVIQKLNKTEKTSGKIPVKIIDYKTSTPKSRNVLLGETKSADKKYLRQLQFYKLLTELDQRFPYKVEEFELKFIKSNASGIFKAETFSSDEINTEEIKETIFEVMESIRKLRFDTVKELKRI